MLPSSRPSFLPLPSSSLLRSPPQHMHTHDTTSQLQLSSMLQPSIVPLVSEPSNCHFPQVQALQVLVQPAGLPCSSFSLSMIHTPLSSQVA